MNDYTSNQVNQASVPQTPQKVCKKCKRQIDANLMICPYCGKNLKPAYKKPWFWILIVLALIVLMIVGCTAACGVGVNNAVNNSTTSASNVGTTKDANKKYDITDVQLVNKGSGMVSINGILKNNSGSEKNYISVEYIIKDKDGNQISTALASTNNLAKDGTWKFEATCLKQVDPNAISYELSKVTGF
ncbi:MAG: hypothetical protein HUJ63_00675 [Enterococcus sp.]|nr:hypothetical protein [Enterococcus sp.]